MMRGGVGTVAARTKVEATRSVDPEIDSGQAPLAQVQLKNCAAWAPPDRRRPRGEHVIGTAFPITERPVFVAMIAQ